MRGQKRSDLKQFLWMKATVTDMQQFAFSVQIDCENS